MHRAEGFYVYYWYVVVSAVISVLTFMETAVIHKLTNNQQQKLAGGFPAHQEQNDAEES